MTQETAATIQAWAAIAQAVGSVMAIIAAIWIANRQHRQNIELVENERARVAGVDRRRNEAIYDVAMRCIGKIHVRWMAVSEIHTQRLLISQSGRYLELDAISNELLGTLEELRNAVLKAIWEFEQLKDAYQMWGAIYALYHFETVESLARMRDRIGTAEIVISHESLSSLVSYNRPEDEHSDDILAELAIIDGRLTKALGRLAESDVGKVVQ
ncbi:hypothetical protein RM61_15055 [Xanthomonas phaseoli pv. phaseoli]|uniref:hypothetical protein n=1 Tax=Xanthomonas phaseoli TaxID=1985254 RepID=UPI00057413F6|nr:hypothetical protein [Xanthomonas phaseoli]KHS06585.1 hypothetical protein RM61_15055 [Xanthomonas phaseoli pv. phaseoli]